MHLIHAALPCRIIDDFGGAFAMGAIGGSVWHGVKGYRNSPSGMKMRSSIGAIKARAPVLGGVCVTRDRINRLHVRNICAFTKSRSSLLVKNTCALPNSRSISVFMNSPVTAKPVRKLCGMGRHVLNV